MSEFNNWTRKTMGYIMIAAVSLGVVGQSQLNMNKGFESTDQKIERLEQHMKVLNNIAQEYVDSKSKPMDIFPQPFDSTLRKSIVNKLTEYSDRSNVSFKEPMSRRIDKIENLADSIMFLIDIRDKDLWKSAK